MPARRGQKPSISTSSLLEAVASRGSRWPAAFASEEITTVNEAVDRELLSGNLIDACTLSDQGRRLLEEVPLQPQGPAV